MFKPLVVFMKHFLKKSMLNQTGRRNNKTGADPGFQERGFINIKVWGSCYCILSHFS